MIRRIVGSGGGPLVAGVMAALALAVNGRKLRSLSAREMRAVDGVCPGLDLTTVRVAEGCRLPLLPGFVAITLGRTVYLRDRLEKHRAGLLAHELAHVQQFATRGWIGMTAEYGALWMEHGYARHPMELEARAAEVRAG